MTVARTLTLLASAARTASGTATVDAASEYDSVDIYLDVTAVSGTSPSMTVTYQTSMDGGTTWFDVTAGAAITAAGKQAINVSRPGAMGRISYAITGTTPSFTFSAIAQLRRSGN